MHCKHDVAVLFAFEHMLEAMRPVGVTAVADIPPHVGGVDSSEKVVRSLVS